MKGKEGGLMVEQDFDRNFTGQHYMVFRFFFPLASVTEP